MDGASSGGFDLSSLSEAARIAMTEVLGLREEEEVLILTNPERDSSAIGMALFEETKRLGGRPVVVMQEKKTSLDNAERITLEAIRSAPDVIISVGTNKVGKDPHGLLVGYVGRDGQKRTHIFDLVLDGDRRSRSFWSPGATVDMFERCVAIDYEALRARAAKLKQRLDVGKTVHVTSPGGTDLTFSIEGRQGKVDDGDFRLPGMGGNLPTGEAYVSPANGTAKGVIVFDGTLDLIGRAVIPKAPVRVEFADGYVSSVTGGEEAGMLLDTIEQGERMAREKGLKAEERNARHLGEMGIGLNYEARISGNLLEDEKVGRTVHFAIGMNLDNDAHALIHQDCLVSMPSMWIDDEQIMKDGEIII
jgi:aminopeptidase